MNTMQEALKKAGLAAEDFKGNEGIKFSMFPMINKWRSVIPDRWENFDAEYKYRNGFRSAPLNKWMDKQDRTIIRFLRDNKDRVYLFPEDKCQKYLECWIGYNTAFQTFTIRLNHLGQTIYPYIMSPTNPYARDFVVAMDEVLELQKKDPEGMKLLDFTKLCNMLTPDNISAIIRKTFTMGIIPVESFDPIMEVNNTISKNLITTGSINLDEIRKELAELEKSQQILSNTKVHRNVIELYCEFNNIRVVDPTVAMEKKIWLNIIFAKDSSTDIKKNKSFFIVI